MYPRLFAIGEFEVSTFGVMVAIAVLVGGGLLARAFDRAQLERDLAWRLVSWGVVGGMLGAKLWYVAEQVARQPETSAEQWLFSRGGLTWYGGLLGGTLVGLITARISKVPVVSLINMAAPTLAIGQAIGRIGCLLVGDDYGGPTELPWGIAFPAGLPPTEVPVHPTMVYETLWLGVAALWLWRRQARSPFLFGEYLMWAGLGRLWIEAFRLNPSILGPLSNAQAAAVACIVLGAGGWLYARGRDPDRFSRNAPV